MRPYYEDGAVTLYHGDCRDLLPALEASSLHITLTDAPYNGDLTYGDGTNDSRPWPEYLEWLDGIIAGCERICTGPVICYVSKPGLIGMARRREPWWVGQWVGGGANPAGPNNGLMFSPGYEPCLFYGNRYGLRRCIPDVWHAPTEMVRLGHPCPKPLRLMRAMLVSLQPDSVLDPFAGSGTTLRAAKDLGIRAVGIEVEERFCEIIARRMAQEVLELVI